MDTNSTRVASLGEARAWRGAGGRMTWGAAMALLEPLRAAQPGAAVLGAVVCPLANGVAGPGVAAAFMVPGQVPVAALVLGRHPCCAADVPTASLRHVAVLATEVDGEMHVRVQDLNTAVGFSVPLSGPLSRLEARRGVRVVVGSAEVLLVAVRAGEPLAGMAEPDAVDVMDPHEHVEEDVQVARARRGGVSLVRPLERAPREQSWVEYVKARDADAEPRADGWAGEPVTAHVDVDGAVRDAMGRIVHPGEWGTLTLTEDDLRRGALLGRYARCSRSSMLAADERVSRVHALLTRFHGRLLVVDTASSNGTLVLNADGTERCELGHPQSVAELGAREGVALGGYAFDVRVEGEA